MTDPFIERFGKTKEEYVAQMRATRDLFTEEELEDVIRLEIDGIEEVAAHEKEIGRKLYIHYASNKQIKCGMSDHDARYDAVTFTKARVTCPACRKGI